MAESRKGDKKYLQHQFWLLKFDEHNDEHNSTHNEAAHTGKYERVVSKKNLGVKYTGVLGGWKC